MINPFLVIIINFVRWRLSLRIFNDKVTEKIFVLAEDTSSSVISKCSDRVIAVMATRVVHEDSFILEEGSQHHRQANRSSSNAFPTLLHPSCLPLLHCFLFITDMNEMTDILSRAVKFFIKILERLTCYFSSEATNHIREDFKKKSVKRMTLCKKGGGLRKKSKSCKGINMTKLKDWYLDDDKAEFYQRVVS